MAVGGLTTASQGDTIADSWNGANWSLSPLISSPSPSPSRGDLYGISCTAASHCVAVGETGVQRASSYLWNGSRWSPLPTPTP